MKGISPALSSYFQLLLKTEMDVSDCSQIKIVDDNARIPSHYSSSLSTTTPTATQSSATSTDAFHIDTDTVVADDDNESKVDEGDNESPVSLHERLSRSVSDILSVSFPPAFLLEDPHSSASSRWESFNATTAASCDLSLAVPRRTRDYEDELRVAVKVKAEKEAPHKMAYVVVESQLVPTRPGKDSCLRPTRSVDSVKRLVREHSIDTTSSNTPINTTPSFTARLATRKAHWECIDEILDRNVDIDSWPSLRSFDLCLIQSRPHPELDIHRRMSKASLQFLPSLLRDQIESNINHVPEVHEEDPTADSLLDRVDGRDRLDKYVTEMEHGSLSAPTFLKDPKSLVKYQCASSSPATIAVKLESSSSTKRVEPSKDWIGFKVESLPHRISRRTLVHFPLPLSLVSSTHETTKAQR
jgi:hypothetical protein